MIIAISGYKGAGKTTFIDELLSLLENQYDVLVIKDTHGEIDVKGKDTYRHTEAGACASVIVGDKETAIFFKERMGVEEITSLINPDIVLLEGFKGSQYKKIWLGGGDGENVVMRNPSVEDAYNYILGEVEKERVLKKLPGIDCGECGHATCGEMAEAIVKGEASIGDCKLLKRKSVAIKVNGKTIYVKEFVADMVENVVRGMISSLKGGENAKEGKVEIKISAGSDIF